MKRYCLHLIPLFAILLSTFLLPLNAEAGQESAFGNAHPAGSYSSAVEGQKYILYNKTGSILKFSLVGPVQTTLNLNKGKNEVQLAEGTYRYSYQACGQTFSGNLLVKKNYVHRLILPSCQSGGPTSSAEAIAVTIQNSTDKVLTIALHGKTNYTFTLSPGATNVEILAGKYRVRAFGCLSSMISRIRIDKPIDWYFSCSQEPWVDPK